MLESALAHVRLEVGACSVCRGRPTGPGPRRTLKSSSKLSCQRFDAWASEASLGCPSVGRRHDAELVGGAGVLREPEARLALGALGCLGDLLPRTPGSRRCTTTSRPRRAGVNPASATSCASAGAAAGYARLGDPGEDRERLDLLGDDAHLGERRGHGRVVLPHLADLGEHDPELLGALRRHLAEAEASGGPRVSRTRPATSSGPPVPRGGPAARSRWTSCRRS